RTSKVASSSDCVIVAISPRWKSTVTRFVGSVLIFSAKSASDEPRRRRSGVLPSPRGTVTPPTDGACICSSSARFARFDFRPFSRGPPPRPQAPRVLPPPRPDPRPPGPPGPRRGPPPGPPPGPPGPPGALPRPPPRPRPGAGLFSAEFFSIEGLGRGAPGRGPGRGPEELSSPAPRDV